MCSDIVNKVIAMFQGFPLPSTNHTTQLLTTRLDSIYNKYDTEDGEGQADATRPCH